MVRSFPRPLFWLAFALATLWLSLIAAPRRVSGQDFSSPSRSYFSPRAVPVEVHSADSVPPDFTTPRIQAAPPAVLGTASSPNYWIVSSRDDVQHRRHQHLDDGELDVYQRTPDGRLCPTNLALLRSQIIPGVPVLICIHGVFVRWEDECLESHQAYQWIRNACPQLPLQVIFFTWPSDGIITCLIPVDVNIRSKQAEFNSLHVARLINGIPESCPVSFIGHSLGCRTILSTLHLAGGGEVQGFCCPDGLGPNRRFRAVFAAAAVDHNWLNPHDRYGCALPRTECIVNLQNRKDLPLAFYPLYRPFAGRAIARSGLTRRDKSKLGPQSEKFINLDVTMTQGHNHLWPGYFRRPDIAAAIAPVIYYPGVAQYTDTPADEWPSAPQTEHRLAPQPTPLSPTEFESEPPHPLPDHPPVDDFLRSDPPAPPRLVPRMP
jgi:Alpha/beta hydrolase of unknown function (DUF900)